MTIVKNSECEKYGSWFAAYVCDNCNYVAGALLRICPECGVMSKLGKCNWSPKVARQVYCAKWYNPRTWGRYYELKDQDYRE